MDNQQNGQIFDLVVIGGGPGGYVAAIRASQLGLAVAVIERENLGGICLNWGCIPTKALLRTAEIYHTIQNAEEYGISVNGLSCDIEKVVKRSRKVAKKLSSGISHLMKKNDITVFMAQANLGPATSSGRMILIDGKQEKAIYGRKVILATGARARTLAGIEPDGNNIVTYRDAMTPTSLPKNLIIIGSGAIGMEFASFYADLGVEVTVLEAMERILPAEDEEISAMAEKAFSHRGITIHKSARVEGVTSGDTGVAVALAGKSEKITAERLILAVGIIANTEGLGLEQTAVRLDRGHVITGSGMQTDEPGIYAIGDMTGAPWLAHKASHEAVIAAEHIAGIADGHGLAADSIPGCTYCRPQIASIGLTEKAALDHGHEIRVGRFPFVGNGKALALGDQEGMIKTVFDAKTGALLGAHMIGPEVTELIQGYAIARRLETTEAELMDTVFPHPTLSEAMHESVLDAYGRALHF